MLEARAWLVVDGACSFGSRGFALALRLSGQINVPRSDRSAVHAMPGVRGFGGHWARHGGCLVCEGFCQAV